jgi:hypothetical protein
LFGYRNNAKIQFEEEENGLYSRKGDNLGEEIDETKLESGPGGIALRVIIF